MIKFETGKKYYGKEHKNYGKYISRDSTKVEIEIVKRSEKMVTILHNGEQNRKKIFIDSNGTEYIKLNLICIYADKEIKEETKVNEIAEETETNTKEIVENNNEVVTAGNHNVLSKEVKQVILKFLTKANKKGYDTFGVKYYINSDGLLLMKIPLRYHKMYAKITIGLDGNYVTGSILGKDDYKQVRIDLKNNSIEYIEKVS